MKPKRKSKTIWFNVLVVVLIEMYPQLILTVGTTWAFVIVAFLNIVLRLVTKDQLR